MPFWQFFRKGRDGCALLVRPSRIHHRISKILFVLGSYEFLAMLEGKIGVTPFFKVQSGKITVWAVLGNINGLPRELEFAIKVIPFLPLNGRHHPATKELPGA